MKQLILAAVFTVGLITLAWASTRYDWPGESYFEGIGEDGTGKVVCIKADKDLGTCSDQPNSSGVCTCN